MKQQINKVKEILSQAYRVEQRINTKWEQIHSLRELAYGTMNTLSDMPGSPNRNIDKKENYIIKMVDLQSELYDDINNLLDAKKKSMALIKKVENVDGQLILEKRYLCYKKWEEIAMDLKLSSRQIYRLHDDAIKYLETVL